MKRLIFAMTLVLVCAFTGSVHAQDWYMEKDRLFQGRTNIYDKYGSKKGYIEEDRLFQNRLNMYDKRGRKEGYLQPNTLFKGRWEYHDASPWR